MMSDSDAKIIVFLGLMGLFGSILGLLYGITLSNIFIAICGGFMLGMTVMIFIIFFWGD